MSDVLRRLREQNQALIEARTTALVQEQQRQMHELHQAIRSPLLEIVEANQRAIRAITRSPFLELAERTRRQHQMMFGPLQQLMRPSPFTAMLTNDQLWRQTAFQRTLFYPALGIASAVLDSRRQMLAANFSALSATRTSSRSLATLALSSPLLDLQRQLRESLRWARWNPEQWPAGEPASDGPPVSLSWDESTGRALREFRASLPRQQLDRILLFELLVAVSVQVASPYLSEPDRAEVELADTLVLVGLLLWQLLHTND